MLNSPSSPPEAKDLAPETASKLYPQFVSTVYDALIGPTAGTIPLFQSTCEKLWPRFVEPSMNGETPPGGEWDFSRLLVRNRAMFGRQGEEESGLVHRIIDSSSSSVAKNKNALLPSLPYYSTLVLTSGYLAAHIPSRLDTIFFSKFSSSSLSARNKRAHHRRRLKMLSSSNGAAATTPLSPGKKQQTRITKSTLESAFASSSATISSSTEAGGGEGSILSARPFPLERLISIYHAIDPNPPANNPIRVSPVADVVYTELATLRRLRLLVPASGAIGSHTVDLGEKWCVNVSGDWIGEMARRVGVEVGEWLAGGLD